MTEPRKWDWEREASAQMAAKLEAQTALLAITEALDLRLAEMGNGWTEGTLKIIERIATIVDESERSFRERDAALARVATLEDALRPLLAAAEQEVAEKVGTAESLRGGAEMWAAKHPHSEYMAAGVRRRILLARAVIAARAVLAPLEPRTLETDLLEDR